MSENGPTLIKGLHADFRPAVWDGHNNSKIRCLGAQVLVLMDECSSITAGGIELTEDHVEKMSLGAEGGVLVHVSEGAFRLYEDGTPWTGYRPKAGDRVAIEKFAGQLVRGRDGVRYRLMDYKAVGAFYEPDEQQGVVE